MLGQNKNAIECEFTNYLLNIGNDTLVNEIEYISDEIVKSKDELLQMKIGVLSRIDNIEVINEYHTIMYEKVKYIEYLTFLLNISYDILNERIEQYETSLL